MYTFLGRMFLESLISWVVHGNKFDLVIAFGKSFFFLYLFSSIIEKTRRKIIEKPEYLPNTEIYKYKITLLPPILEYGGSTVENFVVLWSPVNDAYQEKKIR